MNEAIYGCVNKKNESLIVEMWVFGQIFHYLNAAVPVPLLLSTFSARYYTFMRVELVREDKKHKNKQQVSFFH